MVRFCDREVMCVELDKIERRELLRYFLNGHIGDVICVLNAVGGYLGMITYYSLLHSVSINNAILRKHVTLDKNIWKNIRHLFNESGRNEYELVPVVDAEGQLISFAYEDADANREIRILRELMETSEALQFLDIYPEYQCVRIYEFNELGFFFAKYLKSQGISVQVHGALWEYINEQFEGKEFLEYQCMNIYAEGIAPKSADWMENLLRTVSVEFECIDKIYEANIKKGIIKDADGGHEILIMKLQRAHAVAILGTGVESQDAYDYLLQRGIETCCFVVDGEGMCEDRLFGKPIFNLREVISRFGTEIVFIECLKKSSAWGTGDFGVDYFDYMGFERNKRFFCLKDYMQLQGNSLKTVLKDRKVVLAGDYYLCEWLADYLENNCECREKICYLKMRNNEGLVTNEGLTRIDAEDMEVDVLCLIVFPEYHNHPVYTEVRKKCKCLEKEIKGILEQKNIYDYSDYFSHMIPFINIEKQTKNKYPHEGLRVKRIVLGSINSRNGNFFFRGLLDGHPSVMLWDEYSYLNNNLFWFCIRLANRDVEEIIFLLKAMYRLEATDEEYEDERLKKFLEMICILLTKGERYTSQELFIAFHMANTYMRAMCVGGGGGTRKLYIGNLILYQGNIWRNVYNG